MPIRERQGNRNRSAPISWVEYVEGAEYKKWYRKPVAGGEAVLILDEVAMAQDKDYFRLSDVSISPNGKLMAYAADDNGSERFEVRFTDLTSGKALPDVIPGTLSSLVWTANSDALLYGLANENWRTDNVRLHKLGTPLRPSISQPPTSPFTVKPSVSRCVFTG